MHIHAGSTCTGDALGHFYTGAVTSDPWTSISYTSSAGGEASDTFVVNTGASSSELVGKAFIVHGFDGGRIGCALLGTGAGASLSAGGFVNYFSYSGSLNVSGTVGPMTTSGTEQTFSYTLAGLDTRCSSGAGTAANSCACLAAP